MSWHFGWYGAFVIEAEDPDPDPTPTPVPVPIEYGDEEYEDYEANAIDRLPEQFRSDPLEE